MVYTALQTAQEVLHVKIRYSNFGESTWCLGHWAPSGQCFVVYRCKRSAGLKRKNCTSSTTRPHPHSQTRLISPSSCRLGVGWRTSVRPSPPSLTPCFQVLSFTCFGHIRAAYSLNNLMHLVSIILHNVPPDPTFTSFIQ